jgi:hypothetical protein
MLAVKQLGSGHTNREQKDEPGVGFYCCFAELQRPEQTRESCGAKMSLEWVGTALALLPWVSHGAWEAQTMFVAVVSGLPSHMMILFKVT